MGEPVISSLLVFHECVGQDQQSSSKLKPVEDIELLSRRGESDFKHVVVVVKEKHEHWHPDGIEQSNRRLTRMQKVMVLLTFFYIIIATTLTLALLKDLILFETI